MNRDESTAFLRSDEDDPDFLRDKPTGLCPWCGSPLFPDTNEDREEVWGHLNPYPSHCSWAESETELDNRARYQEERMADARVNERVNREVARGKDAPY